MKTRIQALDAATRSKITQADILKAAVLHSKPAVLYGRMADVAVLSGYSREDSEALRHMSPQAVLEFERQQKASAASR